jgi:hypothetical protein
MGRTEQRKAERNNRIANRKGKLVLSPQELAYIKEDVTATAAMYDTEMLMTCFALAERRLLGFGKKRILRSLRYIDGLMDGILDGTATIEDYKKELENEAHVAIKC